MANEQSNTLVLNLSKEAYAALDKIAILRDSPNVQHALTSAIGTELFIQEQLQQGWRFQLEKGNRYRTIHWPAHTKMGRVYQWLVMKIERGLSTFGL